MTEQNPSASVLGSSPNPNQIEQEDDDDPYASILLEVCYPRHSPQGEHALRLIHADQTETLHECRFIDHFPEDYGAIIPPESLGDYLCLTPVTSHHQDHHTPTHTHTHTHDDNTHTHTHDDNNTNNTSFVPLPCSQTETVHDYGVVIPTESLGDGLCRTPVISNDHHHNYYIEGPHCPCVVSYQILSPPPVESPPPPPPSPPPLASPSPSPSPDRLEIDHHYHEGSVDNVEGECLWLSKLKSMARLEMLFDDVISLVIRFRAYQRRLLHSPSPPKKKRLRSSSKSRQKVMSYVSRYKVKIVRVQEDFGHLINARDVFYMFA